MNQSVHDELLAAMDVDIWLARIETKSGAEENHFSPELEETGKLKRFSEQSINAEDNVISEEGAWEKLRQEVAACTRCPLHKTRTQTVFGVGNMHADLMFIGEAPGAQEDKQGEPFVGRAGQLLDAMLHSIGLSRQQIYIANILKSRPPNNRDPLPEEVAACTPFLTQQIALVKPKLLVALGRIAAHFLLNTDSPLSSLRGKLFKYGQNNIPLLVMYHPAYLLRSPQNKSKAYEDLCLVKAKLEELSGSKTKDTR